MNTFIVCEVFQGGKKIIQHQLLVIAKDGVQGIEYRFPYPMQLFDENGASITEISIQAVVKVPRKPL